MLAAAGITAVAAIVMVVGLAVFLRDTDDSANPAIVPGGVVDVVPDEGTEGGANDGDDDLDSTGGDGETFIEGEGEDESGAEGEGEGDTGDEPTTTASTTTPSTTSSTTTAPLADIYLDPDLIEGRYVAVVWSGLEPADTAATQAIVAEQIRIREANLGVSLEAIDSNDFTSLRDGTVAVAYLGPTPFFSAQDAANWCAARGLNNSFECFGVVLDQIHHHSERGEFIRVYPT